MADGQLGAVLRHLANLGAAREGERLTDGELLRQLDGPGAEGAFTALVWRHGPMVLGTVRRALRDAHEAEDAFQATFLVLFRRARYLDRRGSVAGWLYTVAFHAAHKARAAATRRRLREGLAVKRSRAGPTAEGNWEDLRPVLDEELSRLPERLRAPVVLCYLEGKTNEEAARLLGCPAGTVKSRLARARGLLRTALVRRGVTPTVGLLGGLLTEKARATVPAPLLQAAVRSAFRPEAGAAAVTLARGVLQTMFRTKLHLTVGLLAFAALALGAGVFSYPAGASGPETRPPAASAPVALAPEARAPAEDEPAKYVQLFAKVRAAVGELYEVDYANVYDGRIEFGAPVVPGLLREWRLGRFVENTRGIRHRGSVRILVAEDGGFTVEVVVSAFAEREPLRRAKATGWAAVIDRLFEPEGLRWAPAGRNPGLEATILRRLKQARLGDAVRLYPATPAPTPQAGTSPTSAPRN